MQSPSIIFDDAIEEGYFTADPAPDTLPSIDHLILTPGQEAALSAFHEFLLAPSQALFVLSGYAGCGKSTLIRFLLDRLPGFMNTIALIDPDALAPQLDVILSATTNKAAEALSRITGNTAQTIHSILGLRVNTDYKTGVTRLISGSHSVLEYVLLFIDEASFIDQQLLTFIHQKVNPKTCKIVFIGDPAQLVPVGATHARIFHSGFKGAELTEVVRQAAGNPIIDLATQFRHTVNSGEFFQFKPDGVHVQYLGRADFDAAILTEFARSDWHFNDSKILAWTNKRVIQYNNAVRNHMQGQQEFCVGDYAICNSHVQIGRHRIKTDELVEITAISEDFDHRNVPGNFYVLNNKMRTYVPKSLETKNTRLKQAKAENDIGLLAEIDNEWADLRAAYACTINKSQGSTYDKVFIDLDDVRRCTSGDQIARMMYVAVSRARSNVYLTGDLA